MSDDPNVITSGDGSEATPSPAVTATPQQAAPQAPAQPQSRLGAILGAVASTLGAGIAGGATQEGRRGGFAAGMAGGAGQELNQQARQQDIKFKTFDDQVRLAELHNQDLQQQGRTQERKDAHIKADIDNRAMANSLGIDYNTIANDGDTVMDHLKAQTAANGGASVTPGTHIAADGKTINIPQDTQQTRDGQKAMYSALAPALGLPQLPQWSDFVPPKLLNMMTNKIHGYDINGAPIKHEDLPGVIGAVQAQRDAMAQNGATDDQLKTLDNMLGIYKANLGALDTHAAQVAQDAAKAKAAGTIAAQTNPDAIAAEGKKAASIKQAQLDVENTPENQAKAVSLAGQKSAAETTAKNAVGGQMFVGTSKDGRQIAGTSGDLATAGASGVTKLDADTQKKAIVSRQLIAPNGLFNDVKNDIANLEKNGQLGTVASRWNDFMAGKVGDDPNFAALNTHMGLLSTALMQAHVGARGSHEMLEHFQGLMNQKISSPQQLKKQLNAAYGYVKEKAMLP